MEQITRLNGLYSYAGKIYETADEVYLAFREDYHRGLGKAIRNRLDRIGCRKERVHGFGLVFDCGIPNPNRVYGHKYNCRLMGLMGICYVRTMGLWDYYDVDDDDFDSWFCYVFSKGSGMLRTLGIRNKVGRTSKRLKTRFK